MKYKLLNPLGPWKAGTSATREWWNDEGLFLELLDDDAWFERVEEERKPDPYYSMAAMVSFGLHCHLSTERAAYANIDQEFEDWQENNKGYFASQPVFNDPREGWTVELMRVALAAEKSVEACTEDDVEAVTWFLDRIETLNPKKPFPGWTGKDLMSMAQFAVEMDDIGRVDWVSIDNWQKWQSGYRFPAKKPDPKPDNPKESRQEIIDLIDYVIGHCKSLSPPHWKKAGVLLREFGKFTSYDPKPRTYTEAEVLDFGAECITASYTKPAGYTNEHHLRKVFSEWSGQEPAEVFTFDDMEGVIFAYLRHIEQQKPSGPKTPSRFIKIWLKSRKK